MLSDFFVIKKLTNKELGKYQTVFKFFLKIIEFRLNKKEFKLKINRKNK